MSCSARSGSHRYIITILRCHEKQLIITAMQPVTWKSGTMRMKLGGAPDPDSFFEPRRAALMVDAEKKAMIVWQIAPWVDTAPLGTPVVPEV